MDKIIYLIEKDGKYYKVGNYKGKPVVWVKDYYKSTYFETYKEADKENISLKLGGLVTRFIV